MAYIVFHDLFISFLKHWSYLADLKDFWESTRIDMKVVKSYKCWRNNLADLLIKIVGISLAFSCSNSFIISSISKLYVSNVLTVLLLEILDNSLHRFCYQRVLSVKGWSRNTFGQSVFRSRYLILFTESKNIKSKMKSTYCLIHFFEFRLKC